MDSELLFKFIGYFPDYLSPLSRTLLRPFWTTFVETAVYDIRKFIGSNPVGRIRFLFFRVWLGY